MMVAKWLFSNFTIYCREKSSLPIYIKEDTCIPSLLKEILYCHYLDPKVVLNLVSGSPFKEVSVFF